MYIIVDLHKSHVYNELIDLEPGRGNCWFISKYYRPNQFTFPYPVATPPKNYTKANRWTFLDGGAALKQKHFIDSHKGVTGLVILLLIVLYRQQENPTACVYLALHGTYGVLWVLKSRIFPDRAWEQPIPLWMGLLNWGGLTLYWVAPWLIITRGTQAPGWYLMLCIILYAVGIFLHFTADMQKHVALRLKSGHLIQDGLFTRIRNPNYLGELFIYLSFSLLAMHWLPLVILLALVGGVWLPLMLKKDRSLSRYPEFAAYRARTKLFIPFLF